MKNKFFAEEEKFSSDDKNGCGCSSEESAEYEEETKSCSGKKSK